MPGADLILDKGLVPTGATGQFKVVKILGTSANERCTQTTTDERPFGVCQEDVSAADALNEKVAQVRVIGTSTCIAGAAIARGTPVKCGLLGKVIAATVANEILVGIALETVTTDGDHVHVLLTPGAKF